MNCPYDLTTGARACFDTTDASFHFTFDLRGRESGEYGLAEDEHNDASGSVRHPNLEDDIKVIVEASQRTLHVSFVPCASNTTPTSTRSRTCVRLRYESLRRRASSCLISSARPLQGMIANPSVGRPVAAGEAGLSNLLNILQPIVGRRTAAAGRCEILESPNYVPLLG